MRHASITGPLTPVPASEEKKFSNLFAFGDLVFDIIARRVTKRRIGIPLRSREFQVLSFLAVQSLNNRPSSNEAIQEHLYGECVRADNVVVAFVKNTRKALVKWESIIRIESIRDVGYKLIVVPTEYVPCSKAE